MRTNMAATMLLVCGLLGFPADLWAQISGAGSSGMFGGRSVGQSISPAASSFGGGSISGGFGSSSGIGGTGGIGGFGGSGGIGGQGGFGGLGGSSGMGSFGSSTGAFGSFGSTSRSPSGSSSFIGASSQNNANLLGGIMAGQGGTQGYRSGSGTASPYGYGSSSLQSSFRMPGTSQFGATRMGGAYPNSAYGGSAYGASGYGGASRGYGAAVPGVANSVVIDFAIPNGAAKGHASELSQRLAEMPGLHARSLVSVVILPDGTAALRGTVATQHDRDIAEKIVLLEPGISKVQNELVVVQPGEAAPSRRKAMARHPAGTPAGTPTDTSPPADTAASSSNDLPAGMSSLASSVVQPTSTDSSTASSKQPAAAAEPATSKEPVAAKDSVPPQDAVAVVRVVNKESAEAKPSSAAGSADGPSAALADGAPLQQKAPSAAHSAGRQLASARPDPPGKPQNQGGTAVPSSSKGPVVAQQPAVSKEPATPQVMAAANERGPAVAQGKASPRENQQEITAPQEKATTKQRPTIVVAPGPNGVMIACEDPQVLNEFEQILAGLAGSAETGGPELTIFYLKFAKAAAVAETVERILRGSATASTGASSSGGSSGSWLGGTTNAAAGEAGGGLLGSLLGLGESGSSSTTPAKPFKITPDSRLNALIVQASPAEVAAIEQLLTILDQKESPEEVAVVPRARIIPVKNVQADEIAGILRQVYQDRMVATAGQAGLSPGAQNFMRMLGGGMAGFGGFGGGMPGYGGGMPGFGGNPADAAGNGGRRGRSEETPKMTIGVDMRTNSIILAAPEPLFSEVQQLITQLDDAALSKSDQTMRVVTLHKASSNTMHQALAAIVGGGVQFGAAGGAPTSMASRQFAGQPGGRMGRSSRNGATPSGYQPGGYQANGYQPGGGYQAGGYQAGAGYPATGGYPAGGYQQPGGYTTGNAYPSGAGYQAGGYAPGTAYPSPGGGYQAGGYQAGGYTAPNYSSGAGFPPGGMAPYGTGGRAGTSLRGAQPGFQGPVATPMPTQLPGQGRLLGQ